MNEKSPMHEVCFNITATEAGMIAEVLGHYRRGVAKGDELATLERSELEDEYRARCIEIGNQTAEIWRLQHRKAALLAALKDALPLIYHDADTPRLSRAISILEVARAKAEGRDPSPWEMEEAHE